MKDFEHGGNIYKTLNPVGNSSINILDFSANINPLGVPEKAKDIISKNIESLCNYPDPECNDLRSCLSKYLDLDPENLVIGNGASELIDLIVINLNPKRVLLPAPTFSEYERSALKYGVEVKYIYMEESSGFKIDLLKMKDKINEGDLIFICNPNNPSSTLLASHELEDFIQYAELKKSNIVVDECFIELCLNEKSSSMIKAINIYDNLSVIRAFTKLFALPGLRLGYLASNTKFIKKLWDNKITWSVNALSSQMGPLLFEEEYLKETQKWLLNEIPWLYNQLKKINGIFVFEPQSNFILIKIIDGNYNSENLRDKLLSKGIIIRDASNFKGLDKNFIRVAVKSREENTLLINAFRELMEEA